MTGSPRCGEYCVRVVASCSRPTGRRASRTRLATGCASATQLEEIEHALYRHGFWFVNEFGERGDHGIRDSEWGTAFFTPEWLWRRAGVNWQVDAYHPGRVQENQDLYVLEPR